VPLNLLDEPLSNLDAKLREEARAFLRELIVRLGLSALMVTHDQGEAMAISDRILLLNNGKIEQQGTPQAMYGSPESLFVAEFMGSNNRLAGKVAEVRGDMARVDGDGWSLWGKAGSAVAPGASAVAVARVEQVQWDTAGTHENALPVTLATSMYLGDRWECVCHLGHGGNGQAADPNATRIRAFSNGTRAPGPYRLAIPPEQLWVFPA
ncbi:MAG: lipase, partial [Rhizobacter sp.]|nr:lipase [Rhizobacter sp.]